MELDVANLTTIISSIPGNVFFKDTECRYIMASHICSMLNTAGRSDFSIIGKTDLEIQVQQELGEKYYNEDKELVQNGGELDYVNEMKFGNLVFYYRIQKKAVYNQQGKIIGVIGMVTDITKETVLQHRLERLSITDVMTGFYNRTYYEMFLSSPLDAKRLPLSIITADFDYLKSVNDKFGHAKGDEYIRTGASIIRENVPEKTNIYRIGGDEFVIELPNCIEGRCQSIMQKIGKDFKLTKIGNVSLSVSLGSFTIENEMQDIAEALKTADKNMYEQKQKHHDSSGVSR